MCVVIEMVVKSMKEMREDIQELKKRADKIEKNIEDVYSTNPIWDRVTKMEQRVDTLTDMAHVHATPNLHPNPFNIPLALDYITDRAGENKHGVYTVVHKGYRIVVVPVVPIESCPKRQCSVCDTVISSLSTGQLCTNCYEVLYGENKERTTCQPNRK